MWSDEEFNSELLARLHNLVTASALPPEVPPDEARAARRLINALTPVRATIENARDLIDHPSIPVAPLGDDVVVAGWLSVINGLCGPNAVIAMARSHGQIDFTLHTYSAGDGEDSDVL